MSVGPLALATLGLLGPIQDGPVGERAFAAVVAEHEQAWAGERVTLTLEFGIERAFLRDNLIQPFRRPLDVPVHVQSDWMIAPVGADPVPALRDDEGPRFAFGDDIVRARVAPDRSIEGRPFAVFRMSRDFVVRAAGTLTIPGPRLTVAFATRFEEDFVNGRVAVDRQDLLVAGRGLELVVSPLPVTDQPPAFAGAVGQFTIAASLDDAVLGAGETLRLTLRIEGDGDLAGFAAPRLDQLEGFHVLGQIEVDDRAARVLRYDLAPDRDDLAAVPGLAFTYFDPRAGAYRTVETDPLPFEFRVGAALAEPVPGSRPDRFDLPEFAPHAPDALADAPSPITVVLAILVPWALAFGLLRFLSVRERAALDRDGLRARAAAADFRAALDGADTDLVVAFTAYVAARLRCPRAAVIAPDLAQRMGRAGVSAPLADAAAALVERIVASRYGAGEAATVALRELAVDTVMRLEGEFRRLGGER